MQFLRSIQLFAFRIGKPCNKRQAASSAGKAEPRACQLEFQVRSSYLGIKSEVHSSVVVRDLINKPPGKNFKSFIYLLIWIDLYRPSFSQTTIGFSTQNIKS